LADIGQTDKSIPVTPAMETGGNFCAIKRFLFHANFHDTTRYPESNQT
jgi:hypothetical protein